MKELKELKNILHELRCDIDCIPKTEDNKVEIKNVNETFLKAWNLVISDNSSECEWCGTKKENASGLCSNCGRFPSL